MTMVILMLITGKLMDHTINDVIQCMLLHCVLTVKISSYSFQTKIFLTHHSLKTLKVDQEATEMKG